jgi:hypothetical protein
MEGPLKPRKDLRSWVEGLFDMPIGRMTEMPDPQVELSSHQLKSMRAMVEEVDRPLTISAQEFVSKGQA